MSIVVNNKLAVGVCRYILGVLLCCSFFGQSQAQSVPADLIDLSMDDLFKMEIGSTIASPADSKTVSETDVNSNTDAATLSAKKAAKNINRWSVTYNYRKLKFEGYKKGTTDLSNSDVLFEETQGDTRTNDNFPVLPDVITQEIHAFVTTYRHSRERSVNLILPYVKQSTDHYSVVPNYAEFNITSEGLGDIIVSGSFQLSHNGPETWNASVGLSIPTGSIDEQGDTPRDPGDQQLPYSMQLGSGTYDIPASISYTRALSLMSWGAQFRGKLRLGENDRNYTLGNRVSFLSWARITTINWVEPTLKLAYKYWEHIDGADTEIQIPGPFPFPAPVTNPDLFGGRQADLILAARFPIGSAGQFISLEVNKPIYQNLNGPQSKEILGFSTSINLTF